MRALRREAGDGRDQSFAVTGAARVPRGTAPQTAQDTIWIRQVVDLTVQSSHMKHSGLLGEMSAAILFLASVAASYITGTVLPVGSGDHG